MLQRSTEPFLSISLPFLFQPDQGSRACIGRSCWVEGTAAACRCLWLVDVSARTLPLRTLSLYNIRAYQSSYPVLHAIDITVNMLDSIIFRSAAPVSTDHRNVCLVRQQHNPSIRLQPRRCSGMHRHRDDRHVCVAQSTTSAPAGAVVWNVHNIALLYHVTEQRVTFCF